ncbi:MAG: hypothetical protein Tsb0014_21060 [Pleurocapsa sp.]
MKRFILQAGTSIAVGLLLGFFHIKKPVQAHCTGYHPHHCGLNDIRNLPDQLPDETENGSQSLCAALFITYTRGVLATAGSPFSNARAVRVLKNMGLFSSSEFNNVTFRWADLKGKADGMVPAPNVVLFDYSVKNSDFNYLVSLTAHEMIHIRQLRRMGNEKFACEYSKHILEGKRIAIEKEADNFGKYVSNIMNYSFMIASDRNRNLYVNALDGARHLAPIGLHQDCAKNKYNLDCRWIAYKDGRIVSAKNTSLGLNAFNGARHFAELRLYQNCSSNNPDCTWTWYNNGMLVSDKDKRFPVNAVNGARHYGKLKLHQDCRGSNPDCTWKREYFNFN